MKRRWAIVAVALVVLVAMGGVAGYLLFFSGGGETCSPPTMSSASKYTAQKIQFGGVTEYCLANPSRWANGAVVAADGSLWFGEQALPGFGHLFSNGTLVEYQWPGTAPKTISTYQTGIWGITQWDGRVWGADLDASRLVSVDPATGTMTVVNSSSVPYPYLFSRAPDGSLWFTSLTTTAKVGRLATDMSLASFEVKGLGHEEPIQLAFVNSTLGYMVALNPLSGIGEGGLYSFDPQSANGTIVANRVGGNFSLFFPDGISYTGGMIWVSQHGPSNVLRFDIRADAWTVFPTTRVSYQSSTLPYFIYSSGDKVWFNEHYGNRIAMLNPATGTLTEFSEADPPVSTGSDIQNDLTIAPSADGLWFTSTSGNYVGFVSQDAQPPFSLAASGSNSIALQRGGSTTVTFSLGGSWKDVLQVHVSDSENATTVPDRISVIPQTSTIQPGAGPQTFEASLSVDQGLQPGNYTVAVTVGDGLEFQSAFVFLTVT